MARRRSRSRNSNKSVRRDTSRITNRRLPDFNQYDLIDFINSYRPGDSLREVEDRREYHPEGFDRPARSVSRSRHRLVVAPSPIAVSPAFSSPQSVGSPVSVPNGVAFADSDRVLTCVRRSVRKQVLHALGKAGKRGQKKPRRSAYSDIQC